MTRKTKELRIESGRDAGKRYLITEMSAVSADKWAMRALLALARGGADLAFDPKMGMAGIVGIAFEALAKIAPDDAMPLLDELVTCAQIIPEGGVPRPIEFDGDVEDFTTFWKIRKEVFSLHTDFLQHALGQTMA